MTARQEIDLLIVDDDQVFRDRLAISFKRQGFTVEVAASVTDAIEKLIHYRPKRATVDLKMPGRSGLEMITILKESCPNINIVVLTGYGSISTTEVALKKGANSYLTKPCDTERIMRSFTGEMNNDFKSNLPVPSLAQVEWEHINRIISDCGGNITRAADVLGINRRSLQRRLAKLPRLE